MILVFKSRSCPVVCEYLEDLEFNEQFELSLFETKSKSVVGSTALNPEFVKDLETEKANRSIDDYILKLQNSIVATNIPKFLESTSATLGSSAIASSSKFLPNLLSFPPFPCSLPSPIRNLQCCHLHRSLLPLKHKKFLHLHSHLIHLIHQLLQPILHPQDQL